MSLLVHHRRLQDSVRANYGTTLDSGQLTSEKFSIQDTFRPF
jgi:hypothetical protein